MKNLTLLFLLFALFAKAQYVTSVPNPQQWKGAALTSTATDSVDITRLIGIGSSGITHPVFMHGATLSGNGDTLIFGGGGGSLWAASGSTIHNTNVGNVGIGTAAPANKLQIVGSFKDSTKVGQWIEGIHSASSSGVGYTQAIYAFRPLSGELLGYLLDTTNIISTVGYVNFNNGSQYISQYTGSSSYIGYQDGATQYGALYRSDTTLNLRPSPASIYSIYSPSSDLDSAHFVLTTGGRVGINTAVPNYPLHVFGNARIENSNSLVFIGDNSFSANAGGTGLGMIANGGITLSVIGSNSINPTLILDSLHHNIFIPPVSGYFGVGTSIPTQQFDLTGIYVQHFGSDSLYIDENNDTVRFISNKPIKIGNNSTVFTPAGDLIQHGTITTGGFIMSASAGANKMLVSDGGGVGSWTTGTSSLVGLGNVNNTSDVNKPVSTAQQTALDLKVNTSTQPYTSYQALVSQSATSTPTASVKVNNTGVNYTWGRTSAGLYTLTADSGTPFTSNKTVILMSTPTVGLVTYIVVPTSTSVITFSTVLSSVIATVLTATATDALLNNTLIEVRIYN